MGSIVGAALKGFGKALKKVKPSKSNWIKDKAGTITGVKPGSGNVPWHVGAGGKNLKRRAEIVKTDRRVKTIDAIASAQKKIKEGTATLKKLRTTGWTGKPHGKRGRKSYYPKEEGKASHMVGPKKDKYKKKPWEKKGMSKKDYDDIPF
jgi:hypothetical protein